MAIGKGPKKKRAESLGWWTMCDPDPDLEFQPYACDLTAWLLLCFGPSWGLDKMKRLSLSSACGCTPNKNLTAK
jgi:hypothetical protein